MCNFETVMIKDDISKCESVEELKDSIFPMIRTAREEWIKKINEIIQESSYTMTKFSELCGVSRMAVDKWRKGAIPKNRESFLRIGIVAGYDVEQMNQFLQRYGQYPALYSKSMVDCVCIYVLNNTSQEERVEKYEEILKRIKENITQKEAGESENITTTRFDQQLSEVETDEALERFIEENSDVFAKAYSKFYAYVKMNIQENSKGYADTVHELAEAQSWSSSLRQCISAIRQHSWYPTRNKIISIGLHLSMDHEQIDKMLELAHMEPLCAKNMFESVIMFVLDDASLNDMLDNESEDYDPDALFRYARQVLQSFELPEFDSFIAELAENEDEE